MASEGAVEGRPGVQDPRDEGALGASGIVCASRTAWLGPVMAGGEMALHGVGHVISHYLAHPGSWGWGGSTSPG